MAIYSVFSSILAHSACPHRILVPNFFPFPTEMPSPDLLVFPLPTEEADAEPFFPDLRLVAPVVVVVVVIAAAAAAAAVVAMFLASLAAASILRLRSSCFLWASDFETE